jgi:hypothetical protein
MITATDFAPGGGKRILCAKEAPDYRPARLSRKAEAPAANPKTQRNAFI